MRESQRKIGVNHLHEDSEDQWWRNNGQMDNLWLDGI